MKRILFALISITCSATPTLADKPMTRHFGAMNSCYERVYSDTHLAAHPRQRVARIRLTHHPYDSGPFGADGKPMIYPDARDIVVNLWIGLRDWEGEMYNATGFCWPEGDGMACGLECDGGQFSLVDRGQGKILLRIKNEIYMHDCDAGDEVLSAHPDDKSFLLHRLNDSDCPTLD